MTRARVRSLLTWRGVAALLLLLAACASATTSPHQSDDEIAVLFVGNSLTYSNDLPGMVAALATQAGAHIRATTIANGNYSLEEHWADGVVPHLLRTRRWNFVVMQQGSSALPESQVHLRHWSEQFGPLITASGAEPVLLSVWPLQSRLFDFPNVATSYRNAAAAIDALYAPAGDAWTRFGDYSRLYSDGLHPTTLGTYLAALVVLERITGIRPDQLPDRIPGSNATPATVMQLKEAAMQSLQHNARRPGRLEVVQ